MGMDRHQPQLLTPGTIIADNPDTTTARSPMTTSGPARPAGRYGDRRGRPRPVMVAALVVLVAALGGWVLWAAVGAATPDVRSDVVGFRVVDADSVRARIEVSADRHRPVTCTLQAQDRNHEPVGVARATLPAGPDSTRRAGVVVRTRSLAVTAVIVGCRVGPPAG
jgi:hypothetical protein